MVVKNVPFAETFRRIDKLRETFQYYQNRLADTDKKNKELYKDNVRLEKELMALLSYPEIQTVVNNLKKAEDDYIKSMLDEMLNAKEIKHT